jgi:hypothetical protein
MEEQKKEKVQKTTFTNRPNAICRQTMSVF